MIYVTAAVSAFLFVYLFTALIRPEWFYRDFEDSYAC